MPMATLHVDVLAVLQKESYILQLKSGKIR
jgi:hypothetical protein